VANPEKK